MTAAVLLAVIKDSSIENNKEETSYDVPQHSCCFKECTGKKTVRFGVDTRAYKHEIIAALKDILFLMSV